MKITMETVSYHTTFQNRLYHPFHEEVEQDVPEVGLIFSIADNGYGNGRSSIYIINGVGPLNKDGFSKFFTACPLHHVYSEITQPYEFRRKMVSIDKENKKLSSIQHDKKHPSLFGET